MYERKLDMFYDNKPRIDNNRNVYLSMYIQSSILSKIYKRNYDTFGDYCQQVGSLYSIFSLIFGILNQFIASDDLNIKIAKSLYDFKNSKLFLPKKKSFLFFANTFQRKIKYCWDKFFQNRRKNQLIDKVITKELDLTQILMKIKEIETIKKVLFTKDQKIVLNYINKPKFKNEFKIQSKRDLLYNQKIIKKSFLPLGSISILITGRNNNQHQLMIARENLKKDENEINQRILRMLDDEEFTTKNEKSLKENSLSKSKRKIQSHSILRQIN